MVFPSLNADLTQQLARHRHRSRLLYWTGPVEDVGGRVHPLSLEIHKLRGVPVDSLLRTWSAKALSLYRRAMAGAEPETTRVAPVPRPPELDRFEGMWVAVIDGQVEAAEHTSQKLAMRLHQMDHRKRRRAVVEFVRPTTDSYIIGVG